MTTARTEFGHALANRAMLYLDDGGQGVSPAALEAAKQHVLYGELLAELERTWPGDGQKVSLACDILLAAMFTPRQRSA